MSDLIGRDAVIKLILSGREGDDSRLECPAECNSMLEWAAEEVAKMPAADVPDRKVGKWIPVSEGLPKEHESIWAKAKGTERWSESMWEKQSDEVIVTELFENGTTRTDTACTHDGEWYVKIKAVKRKIIAWMPLPKPWKGEEDE